LSRVLPVYTVRVKPETWRTIGRWLLVPPVLLAGQFGCVLAMMFSVLVDQSCLQWAERFKLNVQPNLLLNLLSVVLFFLVFAIWTVPTAYAIGFALRTGKTARLQWGLSVALLLTIGFEWATKRSEFPVLGTAMAAAIICLVAGIVLSFRLEHRARTHLLANAAAFAVLLLPSFVAFAEASKQPPNAKRLWSTVLQKNTWQAMNTGSEFGAARQAVVVGERVVAVFDAGYPEYVDKQPMSKYRLVSLDIQTGQTKNSREFVGHWGAMPSLFATNDGHVIFEQGSLKSLNPDLTEAGPELNIDHGRVGQISPDGSTLAWETSPGTVLLDSHSLAPIGKPLAESSPNSVSTTAVLTYATIWNAYPKDRTFVGWADEHGLRLLFHGDCGIAQFLTNETVVLVGCGRIRLLNSKGAIFKEETTGRGPARLTSVSQDGKRFALEFSDEKGDPSVLLYEYFLVFDAETLQPVATVRISDLPERQSWSAFSADGKYFVAGNPNSLSLYELP
jgi:hypothetical protein